MIATGRISRILTVALLLGAATNALAADDGVWSVRKSSGDVWMTSTGAQPVSLGKDEVLKPGDNIRTGRNGRVLLVRGDETILVSPNSVIGLPVDKKEGLSTTIVQQAGSILLEVEKRNVKHFEVETPYLAAVVKGTQFRVSVNAASTSVDVIRGQVQVADFKSGQIAQVMPDSTRLLLPKAIRASRWVDRAPSVRSSAASRAHHRSTGSRFPKRASPRRAMPPTGRRSVPSQRSTPRPAPVLVGATHRFIRSAMLPVQRRGIARPGFLPRLVRSG